MPVKQWKVISHYSLNSLFVSKHQWKKNVFMFWNFFYVPTLYFLWSYAFKRSLGALNLIVKTLNLHFLCF